MKERFKLMGRLTTPKMTLPEVEIDTYKTRLQAYEGLKAHREVYGEQWLLWVVPLDERR